MYSQIEPNLFVIGACLAFTYFGLAAGIYREYYFFNVSDTCYQHNNDVISDVYGIKSLIECSTLCTNDNCRSLLFDGNTQRCISYTAHESVTMPGCGWKYAEIDTVRSQMKCIVPGYSYDASNGSCVIYCKAYGTTFGTYLRYGLAANNDATMYRISKQMCLDGCIAATAFVCRSVDFSELTGTCYLSKETAQTQPSSYKIFDKYDYLHRNCA